jgi:uroporphyrinogen decarboxylase
MRQAGRSLPEYRAIRANIGMLDSCLTPDVAAEITLQPVRRHSVDAAIFFSDIVIPLKLAGLPIDIVTGVGPVLENPIRTAKDLDRLVPLDPAALTPIRDAVMATVSELGHTPLIAFGGAPFTLASYLIEGGPSQTLPVSRSMMVEQPQVWEAVLSWCGDVTSQFIRAQVESGASALQVFDSWAGRLTPEDYRTHAVAHSSALLGSLSDLADSTGHPVPRVHFGVGTGPILTDMLGAGATVMGVDSETPLSQASALFDHRVPLQGNIRVDALEWPWEKLRDHVDAVLSEGQSAPGHVVNLGHGVPKDTDPDVLTRIVGHVHEAGGQ